VAATIVSLMALMVALISIVGAGVGAGPQATRKAVIKSRLMNVCLMFSSLDMMKIASKKPRDFLRGFYKPCKISSSARQAQETG
jgi:hypothetical protein